MFSPTVGHTLEMLWNTLWCDVIFILWGPDIKHLDNTCSNEYWVYYCTPMIKPNSWLHSCAGFKEDVTNHRQTVL